MHSYNGVKNQIFFVCFFTIFHKTFPVKTPASNSERRPHGRGVVQNKTRSDSQEETGGKQLHPGLRERLVELVDEKRHVLLDQKRVAEAAEADARHAGEVRGEQQQVGAEGLHFVRPGDLQVHGSVQRHHRAERVQRHHEAARGVAAPVPAVARHGSGQQGRARQAPHHPLPRVHGENGRLEKDGPDRKQLHRDQKRNEGLPSHRSRRERRQGRGPPRRAEARAHDDDRKRHVEQRGGVPLCRNELPRHDLRQNQL